MIGIIAAMDEEVKAVADELTAVTHEQHGGLNFIRGRLADQEVALAKCGIGKVNAGVLTAVMAISYDVTTIINVGIAGGLDPRLRVCDVVIADEVAQWDLDLTAFGDQRGFGSPTYCYQPDLKIVKEFKAAAKPEERLFVGPTVTGDQFIYNTEQIAAIKRYYPQALCADMEGGAIAQVCTQRGIGFLIIRSISDLASADDNQNTFARLTRSASQVAADYCRKAAIRLAK